MKCPLIFSVFFSGHFCINLVWLKDTWSFRILIHVLWPADRTETYRGHRHQGIPPITEKIDYCPGTNEKSPEKPLFCYLPSIWFGPSWFSLLPVLRDGFKYSCITVFWSLCQMDVEERCFWIWLINDYCFILFYLLSSIIWLRLFKSGHSSI